MLLMRPCEMVLRKILPYSMPGRRRLWTYSARPVTFSQDSRRGTARPTCAVSAGWLARFMNGPLHVDPHQLLLVRRRAVQVALDRQRVDGVGRREPRRTVGRRADKDGLARSVEHDRDAD